jgi:N-acetylneuraminate synthase/N,N'-diacetyllegionaminate synthase
MATLEEAAHAVAVARRAGAPEVAVLHCVSAYPTPAGSENLRAIDTLADALEVPIGLSDHSAGGLVTAVAAVARGACLYERHLMLDDGVPSIDADVSSTPDGFRAIVDAMEQARRALGDGRKRCLPCEAPNAVPSRRGLYARRALRAGERVAAADVIPLRPATTMGPGDLRRLVGAVLDRDVAAGAPFELRDIAVEKAS